ncbi:probable pancreatic secretory proteinase inhibitor [Leucoraja erinacea]|uniref:probable pancreatic secretory proteinase inhibitor n=1 Tax=Leucoraja erinaceus TaxID=7782 RepID=UPI002457AEFD|nr:probable pancreatic secretory proteinase inhibitor [Leucoraja erinacea]
MKLISAFALISLCLLSTLAVETSGNYIEPLCGRIQSNTKCPTKYEPVCDSNGVTHKNECILCLEIRATKSQIKIQKFEEC